MPVLTVRLIGKRSVVYTETITCACAISCMHVKTVYTYLFQLKKLKRYLLATCWGFDCFLREELGMFH